MIVGTATSKLSGINFKKTPMNQPVQDYNGLQHLMIGSTQQVTESENENDESRNTQMETGFLNEATESHLQTKRMNINFIDDSQNQTKGTEQIQREI